MKYFLLTVFLFCVVHVSGQTIDQQNLPEVTKALNSRWDENNPVLSPDGKIIYFTRANDSLNVGGVKDKGDIWFSQLDENGYWQEPENLGEPVNDNTRNSILGFSADGSVMFLNIQKRHGGGYISNDGVGFSVKQGNEGWSGPKKMQMDYYLNKSDFQSGCVSKDGRVMLLSMQSYASRGEEDLYVSFYQNGSWTQPKNLGSDINTTAQEMTPFISVDLKTIYFSSNGYGGKGGRDLFKSERLDESWRKWSKPKNLGSEINSNGVELSYFIDYINKVGYFSTTQNSDGYGDIRVMPVDISLPDTIPADTAESFKELAAVVVVPDPVVQSKPELIFRGKVVNAKTVQPIAAAVQLQGDGFEGNINSSATTGLFEVRLPGATSVFNISIKAPGYMGYEETMQNLSTDGKIELFSLTPLTVGTTIRLNKVYFERGKAVLLDSSFSELNRVSEMMLENPGVKIELSGHTDNQGNAKLNLELSKERVNAVLTYLVSNGVNAKRIKGKGYGGTRPVASNASEETRRLNRRVEFKILKSKVD